MRKQNGGALIFLLVVLVFLGGVWAVARGVNKMSFRINDDKRVFDDLTKIIVEGNLLVNNFDGGIDLGDPKFEISLKNVKDYENLLLEKRKRLDDSGNIGQKYLKTIDGVNASISAVRVKMEYLSLIKSDYLDIKDGSLYNLTYSEAFAGKDSFISRSLKIKAEVERLENMKVDSRVASVKEKWVELLTVRRNFMAALEESLKYKVPYQWQLSQSRYPDKEKQVLLEFEKEINSVSKLDWLRLVRFVSGN